MSRLEGLLCKCICIQIANQIWKEFHLSEIILTCFSFYMLNSLHCNTIDIYWISSEMLHTNAEIIFFIEQYLFNNNRESELSIGKSCSASSYTLVHIYHNK